SRINIKLPRTPMQCQTVLTTQLTFQNLLLARPLSISSLSPLIPFKFSNWTHETPPVRDKLIVHWRRMLCPAGRWIILRIITLSGLSSNGWNQTNWDRALQTSIADMLSVHD